VPERKLNLAVRVFLKGTRFTKIVVEHGKGNNTCNSISANERRTTTYRI